MQTLVNNQLTYSISDWQKGYKSQTQEYDYTIDQIEGKIPLELEGTLFRNGPGKLDINGMRYQHPFDGDGMISRISFKGGVAHYSNRFVKTQPYLEEESAQTILYRGVFGTAKPGGWLANLFDFRLKNIANTQVIYWGGKLLALWEAALPHRLDPYTLDTIGLDNLGFLKSNESISAHPRIMGDRLINFRVNPGLSTEIILYEFNFQGELISKQSYSVPGFAFIHDFVVTENYAIFFQNPVTFNPIPYALGFRGAGECVNFQRNGTTQVIIMPRDGKTKPITISTKAGFVFHHVNAFESLDHLHIDSVCYDDLLQVKHRQDFLDIDFQKLAPGELWRTSIDLTTKQVQRELILSRCCEFPTIHPDQVGKPYRYCYIGSAELPTGNHPLQTILKLDLETKEQKIWSAGSRSFIGEPVFVPYGQDDQGWVITVIFNAETEKSEVIILDGVNLELIARLYLQHHIPYGLHGTWTKEYFVI